MTASAWPRRACLGAVAAALFASLPLTAAAQATGQKSVAVISIVEHPALDAVRDGVKSALEQAGYDAGKNLRWQYQSAQGNNSTAAQIARKFIGDRPDAIVAIATPSAQAVVAGTKNIPVVFSAVTDPVAAQLTPSWKPSGSNVTGVSDLLALDKQMALLKQIVPQAKRVGMVYNPGEANSVVVVKQLKALLPQLGLTLVEASAPRSVDVGSAARSLAGKVDVIYTNTDNNVVSAYEALVKVANDVRIPLIAADTRQRQARRRRGPGHRLPRPGPADRPRGGAHPARHAPGRDRTADQRQAAVVRQRGCGAEAGCDLARRTGEDRRRSDSLTRSVSGLAWRCDAVSAWVSARFWQ